MNTATLTDSPAGLAPLAPPQGAAGPAPPAVSEAHRRQFAAFGYAVFRRWFSAEEVEGWGDAMEAVLRHRRGGADFAGVRPERVTPLFAEAPDVFCPLLDDERLLALADGLLGADSLFTGSNDGNLYVGHTPWHIDGGGANGPPLLKVTFYCDPVEEGRGCLSVLPGSHHPDYFRALHRLFFEERSLDPNGPDVPGSTPVPSSPGDVVVFDHRLWHSSWGGWPGRRQFAFSFAPFPKHSWDETWLHGYLARINRRHGKRLLTDRLLETAGPRRRQKLAKLYDMGL